jgi:hypothetical protein
MIKAAEQEHQVRLAIRDEIARNPPYRFVQLQNALKAHGFGNPL